MSYDCGEFWASQAKAPETRTRIRRRWSDTEGHRTRYHVQRSVPEQEQP